MNWIYSIVKFLSIYVAFDVELKSYQKDVLNSFKAWMGHLNTCKEYSESTDLKIATQFKNYPEQAWIRLKNENKIPGDKNHINRQSNAKSNSRPIPNICLQVPTGGGKTILGIHAIKEWGLTKGLVLWMVPTKAIFQQTINAFNDRDHNYRLALDSISNNHTKILKKNDKFTKNDYMNNLCIMMMTVASTSTSNDDFSRKIYRDGSAHDEFFPEYDDDQNQKKLPGNLDKNEHNQIEHSLVNMFKITKPFIILDESHKIGSNIAIREDTKYKNPINEFNPRCIVELSATPKETSNILVKIHGMDLHKEDMIKLPIKLSIEDNNNWKRTLEKAIDHLDHLQETARTSSDKYIRPICVIRVERTGKDQVDKNVIHAKHVEKFLIQHGIPEDAIRIKSAEHDGLKGEDLMDEKSRIRFIITKDALKEGWDCSFAYMLVILDNTRALTSITQLLGRVMRQPYTKKTNNPELDSCYVFCYNQKVRDTVDQVKKTLEKQGMKDLEYQIDTDGRHEDMLKKCPKELRSTDNKNIQLPLVLYKKNKKFFELNYDEDIKANLHFKKIKITFGKEFDFKKPYSRLYDINLYGHVGTIKNEIVHRTEPLDIMFFVHAILDMIPNPWQAYRIAQNGINQLRKYYVDEDIWSNRTEIRNKMFEQVSISISAMAKTHFQKMVQDKKIQFKINEDMEKNGIGSMTALSLESCTPLTDELGESLQRNLYKQTYKLEFNDLESEFALYLDSEDTIEWWHRVAVNQQGGDYKLQGWMHDFVHPDFIIYKKKSHGHQLYIIETKGKHLENIDTQYKENLVNMLNLAYVKTEKSGTLKIDGCTLAILHGDDWRHEFIKLEEKLSQKA